MAYLERAVKEFKDVLTKKNIDLKGKLTIHFGEPFEWDVVYQPSCHEPSEGSNQATSSLHRKSLLEIEHECPSLNSNQISNHDGRSLLEADLDGNDIRLNVENAVVESHLHDKGILSPPVVSVSVINSANTSQALCIPKTKTALPSFENIMKPRRSKIMERSGELQADDEYKLGTQGSSSFDQFPTTLFDRFDFQKPTFEKDNVKKRRMTRRIVNNDSSEAHVAFDHEINSFYNALLSKMEFVTSIPVLNHSAEAASLIELLKNNKGHIEMTPTMKKSVLNCLNMLSKEELIDIIVQSFEVQEKMTEHARIDDNYEMVFSSGSSETEVSCNRRSKAQRSKEEKEKRQTETGNLKVVFSREECTSSSIYRSYMQDLKTSNKEVKLNKSGNVYEMSDTASDFLSVLDCHRKRKRGSTSGQHSANSHNFSSEQSLKPLRKRQCVRTNLKNNRSDLSPPSSISTAGSLKKLRKGNENQCEIEEQLNSKSPQTKCNDFVCSVCCTAFPSRLLYRKHAKKHHAHSYKCDICDKVLKSKDSLYHHQRGLHSKEKPYHCNMCDSSFSFHHSYKLHLQKHNGERPFTCKLCPKTYLTSNHLKEHIQAVHTASCIVCHVCGKKFSYISALKLHLLSHSNDKPYRCSVCDKKFNSKHSLKRHELCHIHNKTFQCDICLKYFKSEYSRKLHRKLHSKVQESKRYSCNICGKSYSYKCILESHVQIHSQFRSFICSVCGKAFKSKASLYTHKYVHNEGQAYSCSMCSKSFKTKNCLLAHTKRHQNDHTFECSICGRKFPDKGGLSKHTKTVHSPRKYFSCKICDKTGTRADNMRTHVKSHRNEVGPSDDPMNFIMCVEKLNPSNSVHQNQPTDGSANIKSNGKSQSLNKISDSRDKQTALTKSNKIDMDLFFHENVPLINGEPVLLSTVETSSELAAQREAYPPLAVSESEVGKVSDNGYMYQVIPCTMEDKNCSLNSNSYLYQQDMETTTHCILSNSSVTPPSNLMPPVVLQAHSGSNADPTLTQFLPNHYENYFHPGGTVLLSDNIVPKTLEPLQMVKTHVEWLVSNAQSVTSNGPVSRDLGTYQ